MTLPESTQERGVYREGVVEEGVQGGGVQGGIASTLPHFASLCLNFTLLYATLRRFRQKRRSRKRDAFAKRARTRGKRARTRAKDGAGAEGRSEERSEE